MTAQSCEGVQEGLRTYIADIGTLRPQPPSRARAQNQVSLPLAKRQIPSPTKDLLVLLLNNGSLSPEPPDGPSLGLGPGGPPVFPRVSRNTWTGSERSELWKETKEAVHLASGKKESNPVES